MFKLLSTANPKIQKGTKMGYLSFILQVVLIVHKTFQDL